MITLTLEGGKKEGRAIGGKGDKRERGRGTGYMGGKEGRGGEE